MNSEPTQRVLRPRTRINYVYEPRQSRRLSRAAAPRHIRTKSVDALAAIKPARRTTRTKSVGSAAVQRNSLALVAAPQKPRPGPVPGPSSNQMNRNNFDDVIPPCVSTAAAIRDLASTVSLQLKDLNTLRLQLQQSQARYDNLLKMDRANRGIIDRLTTDGAQKDEEIYRLRSEVMCHRQRNRVNLLARGGTGGGAYGSIDGGAAEESEADTDLTPISIQAGCASSTPIQIQQIQHSDFDSTQHTGSGSGRNVVVEIQIEQNPADHPSFELDEQVCWLEMDGLTNLDIFEDEVQAQGHHEDEQTQMVDDSIGYLEEEVKKRLAVPVRNPDDTQTQLGNQQKMVLPRNFRPGFRIGITGRNVLLSPPAEADVLSPIMQRLTVVEEEAGQIQSERISEEGKQR